MGRQKTQAEYTRYTIRVPAELYDRIAAAAGEKSVNAEIVERLFRSFDTDNERDFLTMLVEQPEPKVLPPGLAGRIQRKAEERNRSVSEEVVQALEAAYPAPVVTETDQLIEMLEGLFPDKTWERMPETIKNDPATKKLRQYLVYLREERAAGRSEGARARLKEVFGDDANNP